MWRIGVVFVLGTLAARAFGEAREQIALTEALVIDGVARYGRAPIHTDAIEAAIVAGEWEPPSEGDAVALPDGSERVWKDVTADENGSFGGPDFRADYAYIAIESPVERVMILEAIGHRNVAVNGALRYGDPYRTGYVRLPILLRKGRNDLLFRVSRRGFRAILVPPKSDAILNTADRTLPDLLVGQSAARWGAVVVLNATTEPLENTAIVAIDAEGRETWTPQATIPPLSVRKVPFRLKTASPVQAETSGRFTLQLQRACPGADPEILDEATIELRVRRPDEPHVRTFRSRIDGSVQYYAVNPARPSLKRRERPALVLSLHGAGVQATGQAASYAPKPSSVLVAPTNRRPFGFDWEDWGRRDAIEVLELAETTFRTDPWRVYLTGHSMGGHGTWHLGVTFPDRFAAIGPSAGWISFWSYAGAVEYEDATPIEQLLRRAASPSDTLALARNLEQVAVYILHGENDDNVPVDQARRMRDELRPFVADLHYFEKPGVGHWWDDSDEPGVSCVDWAPMFDLFARRRLPRIDEVRDVRFTTMNPSISASAFWATIEAQETISAPSTVDLRLDPWKRRFVGTTENVARLALSVAHLPPGEPFRVELDETTIEEIPDPTESRTIRLERREDGWTLADAPDPFLKGPHRYGPFKEVFGNRVLFVVGTKGTEVESAWAFAKARYDAETFWVRGNGSIEVIPDTQFDPTAEPDRNVVLYGNAATNGAWEVLLGESPVRIERGTLRVGSREVSSDRVGVLFLWPRPGSDVALVGVVGGTGLPGMRLTDRLSYFVSGVAYPDFIALTPDALTRGTAGVLAAGFFGLDWKVESGEFVWNDALVRDERRSD